MMHCADRTFKEGIVYFMEELLCADKIFREGIVYFIVELHCADRIFREGTVYFMAESALYCTAFLPQKFSQEHIVTLYL